MLIRRLGFSFAFAFLSIFLLAASSMAATYYLAPNGNDANNGSITAPWATFNGANSKAVSGDTVYARGGVYTQTAYLSKAGVTWKAYPGEHPVVDGGWPGTLAGDSIGLPTGTNRYSALVGIVASNITFDGFEVRNSRGRCIEVYGTPISNIQILNCSAHNAYMECFIIIGGTTTSQWITNSLIQNCDFYKGCVIWAIYGNSYAGIPSCVLITRTNGVVFRKNKVHDCWFDGIIVGGNLPGTYSNINTTVEYNQIYGNAHSELDVLNCHYNTIRYNLIYGTYPNANGQTNYNSPGIWLGNETEWSQPACYTETYIYGNLIASCSVNMWIEGQGSNAQVYNSYWYNNTSVEATGTWNFYVQNYTGNGHIFKNNIIVQTNGNTGGAPSGLVTADYNHWSKAPSTPLRGSHDTTYPNYAVTSPMIAKTSGWNSLTGGSLTGAEFALQSNSICINKGTSTPVATPQSSFLNAGASNFLTWVFSLVNQSNYGAWDIGASIYGVAQTLNAPGQPYVMSVTP